MTKKVKLFEDYYNGPDRIKSKFAGEEMLNDLAIKQAELEEKIDFIMGPSLMERMKEEAKKLEKSLKNKKKGDK